jgi:hypothetical protein
MSVSDAANKVRPFVSLGHFEFKRLLRDFAGVPREDTVNEEYRRRWRHEGSKRSATLRDGIKEIKGISFPCDEVNLTEIYQPSLEMDLPWSISVVCNSVDGDGSFSQVASHNPEDCLPGQLYSNPKPWDNACPREIMSSGSADTEMIARTERWTIAVHHRVRYEYLE